MLAEVKCHACYQDERLDLSGALLDQTPKEDRQALIGLLFYRCDKCFTTRIELINKVLEDRQNALAPKKPQVLVKRSG